MATDRDKPRRGHALGAPPPLEIGDRVAIDLHLGPHPVLGVVSGVLHSGEALVVRCGRGDSVYAKARVSYYPDEETIRKRAAEFQSRITESL